MRVIFAFICLCCLCKVGKSDQTISDKDKLRVQQLVDGFADSAYGQPVFACFGTREKANFNAVGPNSPISTVSDFILCVDTEKNTAGTPYWRRLSI